MQSKSSLQDEYHDVNFDNGFVGAVSAGDSEFIEKIKMEAEQERKNEARLFSQFDELLELQTSVMRKQLLQEKSKVFDLNEKMEALNMINEKLRQKITEEDEKREKEQQELVEHFKSKEMKQKQAQNSFQQSLQLELEKQRQEFQSKESQYKSQISELNSQLESQKQESMDATHKLKNLEEKSVKDKAEMQRKIKNLEDKNGTLEQQVEHLENHKKEAQKSFIKEAQLAMMLEDKEHQLTEIEKLAGQKIQEMNEVLHDVASWLDMAKMEEFTAMNTSEKQKHLNELQNQMAHLAYIVDQLDNTLEEDTSNKDIFSNRKSVSFADQRKENQPKAPIVMRPRGAVEGRTWLAKTLEKTKELKHFLNQADLERSLEFANNLETRQKVDALISHIQELNSNVVVLGANTKMDDSTPLSISFSNSMQDSLNSSLGKSGSKPAPAKTPSKAKPQSTADTSKMIDRNLPEIMDDIYSSLIFKTKAQKIQYYKERDETINKHKAKINELTGIISDVLMSVEPTLRKKITDLEEVVAIVEKLDKFKKIKEDKYREAIVNLRDKVYQLSSEVDAKTTALDGSERELANLKRLLREKEIELERMAWTMQQLSLSQVMEEHGQES